MIISHRHKFVFFSFPKTGSESLRAALGPYNEVDVVPYVAYRRAQTPFYPHMPPIEAAKAFDALGWDFADYRRITCVRNPYPRLVSLYRMIGEADGMWRMADRFGIKPSFANWVFTTGPSGRGGGGRAHQKWRQFGTWSAYEWGALGTSNPYITDVVRLEDLAQTFAPLMDDIGVKCPELPHLNARAAQDYRPWYDPATRDLVARRYAWDIENLNYSY